MSPIFLLMDHFLYRFSTFREKVKKNLLIRSLIFFSQNKQNKPLFLSQHRNKTLQWMDGMNKFHN